MLHYFYWSVNISNVNVDNVFSEHVLKAIQDIRNNKLRPDSHTIFDYVTKHLATNPGPLFRHNYSDFTKQMKIDLPEKATPSYFKHPSSDFHEVNCKEKISISETLAQAAQPSALTNHSYVGNEVFHTFYVDHIEFEKYVDDIINNLSAKNEVYEKSGRSNDQSELKFLEPEILKLKNGNASLKDENKSKLKIIESLTTCQHCCTIVNIFVPQKIIYKILIPNCTWEQ